jgi:hypothetical protein
VTVFIAVLIGCLIVLPMVMTMRHRARRSDVSTERRGAIAAKLHVDPAELRLVVSTFQRRGLGGRGIVVVVAGQRVYILRKKGLASLHKFELQDIVSVKTARGAGLAGASGSKRMITLVFSEESKRSVVTIDTIWTPSHERDQLLTVLTAKS